MKRALLLAATLAATAAIAQDSMSAMKGKMKDGRYAYKMEMDMGQVPGMPAGMGKQTMNFEHCVTPQDIEKGQLGKGREERNPGNCEIKDFRMSGNTATYKVTCRGEHEMDADNILAFASDGYRLVSKVQMVAGGQRITSSSTTDAKYLGACK